MTFSELKAKIIRACGTTVLNRQLIEKPTEAGFKKILKGCTIPGFQKYIRQYFETVLGKTAETQPDPMVNVKIVTGDEPVEVEEIPTEERLMDILMLGTVEGQTAEVVEEPIEEKPADKIPFIPYEIVDQPTEVIPDESIDEQSEPIDDQAADVVEEKVDEVVEEQTEVIPDESIDEQSEPVEETGEDGVEQPAEETVEEVEAKPKKKRGRKK